MPGKKHSMPNLHHRIHDHLIAKGKTEGVAWAIAVQSVAKGCLSGDTNFKGLQSMNPVSRAAYCKAYSEWRANHPGGSGFGKNPIGRG